MAADVAGFVVESGTHTHHHGLYLVLVGGHPALLLGGTQADPDEIRLCLVDAADDGGVLLRREGTERRRVHAGNHRAGVVLLNSCL